VFSGHTASVQGLAFSPDGTTLYSSSLDGSIYDWDLRRSATLVHEVPAGRPSPHLAFAAEEMHVSPDGTAVVFPGSDQWGFQFRDVATGALSAPSTSDRFLEFSPDGRQYATVDAKRTIRLWDRTTGKLLTSSTARGDDSVADAFTPDGRRLVSAETTTANNAESSLQVLDATTLEPIDGPPLSIVPGAWAVFVTPDGRQAVLFTSPPDFSGSNVVVVDLESRRIVRSIAVKDIGVPPARTLAADGRTAALGDFSGVVAIVDVVTGKTVPAFHAHDGFVESISFAPDVATFVTAGRDGAIKLWDTKTRALLGAVQPLGENRIVRAWFVGPGKVLIAYATGELFEWDTRGDAWERHACAVAGRNFTKIEWAELFPGQAYRVTCTQFPAGT
jgi:WD40 repeat protein